MIRVFKKHFKQSIKIFFIFVFAAVFVFSNFESNIIQINKAYAASPPTVVLNTANGNNFGADTTPTLEFTGTDVDSDNIRYNLQVDTSSSFNSGSVPNQTIDSYSATVDGNFTLYSGTTSMVSQSFTPSTNATLTNAKWSLQKYSGSPTGMATARIYAMTGTYGTTSVPTGTALATSDNFDVSTLTSSFQLTTFNFSGANQITLTAGTHYCLVFAYSGGNISNIVAAGADISSPTASGNSAYYNSSWSYQSGTDFLFSVIGSTGGPLLNKISGTDAGFLDETNGAHLDPFVSGEKIGFTVQAGNALSLGTYYWRVAGKDPTGTNTYGAWATTRTFIISDPPTVTAINPDSGYNIDSVSIVSVTGANFVSGAAVKLTKSGRADISCTGFTFTDSTTLSNGTCPITSAASGAWNVVVTNPDAQTGTLNNGFTVNVPSLNTNINVSKRYAWNDIRGWLDFYGTETVNVTNTRLEGYAVFYGTSENIAFDCNTSPG